MSHSKKSNKRGQQLARTWTIHPGEILREEYLELHIPVPRINDIVLERRGISADTAVRLARFFGTTEGFWLGMQADHDAHCAKKRLHKELAGIIPLNPSKVSAA